MEVNTEAVKTLIDLGGSAILTVMLWLVWRRLNDVTDRLIDIVTELRLQGLIPKPLDTPPDNEA